MVIAVSHALTPLLVLHTATLPVPLDVFFSFFDCTVLFNVRMCVHARVCACVCACACVIMCLCVPECVCDRENPNSKTEVTRIVVKVQSVRERERERRTDLGEGALGHEDAVQCKAGDAQDGGESDAPADHSGTGRVDVGVVG